MATLIIIILLLAIIGMSIYIMIDLKQARNEREDLQRELDYYIGLHNSSVSIFDLLHKEDD